MMLSCTVFEIQCITAYFPKLKKLRDSDHDTFMDSLSSVGWDLLCSTHIPKLKCLVSTNTCNKDIKDTANVKILVLSHPLGELKGNTQGSSVARWKAY